MADPKVTKMVMKVDLQCYKCYRKIKKVLCCCPQIRDQVYDEKQNTVTITVVCCSPEKIMERIACKAGDTVESIEILPDKPKDPEKPPKPAMKPKEPEKKDQEKPKPADKPVEPEKKKEPEKPKPAEKPKDPEKPKEPEKKKEPEKPKPAEPEKPKPQEKTKDPPIAEKPKVVSVEPVKEAAKPPEQGRPPAPAPKAPAPTPAPTPAPAPAPKMQEPALAQAPTLLDPVVQGYPQLTPTGHVPMYPAGMCCCCHEGGPCYHGYGQAPMWYNGYTQPAAYNFPDRNQGYYVNNRCEYFSEENASGCSIM